MNLFWVLWHGLLKVTWPQCGWIVYKTLQRLWPAMHVLHCAQRSVSSLGSNSFLTADCYWVPGSNSRWSMGTLLVAQVALGQHIGRVFHCALLIIISPMTYLTVTDMQEIYERLAQKLVCYVFTCSWFIEDVIYSKYIVLSDRISK